MGGVSDLNISKCNQSTLFSKMIDFFENILLNATYVSVMRPLSVEDNLIFLRNGTDFPARPFIVSALKLLSLFSVGQRGTTVYKSVVLGSCIPVCTLSLSYFCISFRK